MSQSTTMATPTATALRMASRATASTQTASTTSEMANQAITDTPQWSIAQQPEPSDGRNPRSSKKATKEKKWCNLPQLDPYHITNDDAHT
jgi:hypothetical protein